MTEPGEPTTLLAALIAFQAEAPRLTRDETAEVVSKRTGGKYTYKYTPLKTIMAEIQPLLTRYGLVWTTMPGESAQGKPTLTYELAKLVVRMETVDSQTPPVLAEGRQAIVGTMPLMIDGQGTQAYGSALTYARRYALVAVLNLVADDDDDGKTASKRPTGDARPMPKAEREKMEAAVAKAGKDIAVVLGALGLERLEQVTVGHRKAIKELLADV